jgi:hypothetical protein
MSVPLRESTASQRPATGLSAAVAMAGAAMPPSRRAAQVEAFRLVFIILTPVRLAL